MAFAHIANQEKQKKVKPSAVYAWQKYGIKEKEINLIYLGVKEKPTEFVIFAVKIHC